tara:strand:+ start:5317 stop:8685 length:3369 start_codon:yes stop_codon:yes gene_type:complete
MAENGPNKKDVQEIKSLIKAFNEDAKKANKTFAQLTSRGTDLAGAMGRMGAELGKSGDALQRMGQISDTFLKTADKTHEAHQAITDQIKEQYQYELSLAQTAKQKLQAEMKYNAEMENANNAADTLKAFTQQQVQAQQDIVKLQVAKNTGLRGEALSTAASYQLMLQQGTLTKEQYSDIVKTLKEQQDITQELEDQVAMEEAIAQEMLDIEANTNSWGDSLRKTAATAKSIASDPKALGLFALNEVVKVAGKAYEGFEDLRHEGMSAGQALDASFKTFSVNSVLGLSDTKGAVKGLVDEFGTINNVSADTIDNIGTVAHEMGISGQEAASLTAQMSQMTGESTEVAAETLKYTNELAKANGIAPGKITKEMAANTKDMHKFTKGGSKEFAKIAIEAKKVGISMESAASAASGLLDYESSIEAQMEASVLLGKEINMDKARTLALQGDSLGAAKEVVAQAGGLAAFNDMNVLQQEAYAKAAGMSVSELKKAMDAEQNKGKYAEENADQASEHAGHMMEVAVKMGGFLKNNAMLLMTGVQFIASGNAEKMIGYAKDTAHWVKEKAHIAWKKANEFMGGGAAEGAAGATDMASSAAEGAGDVAGGMVETGGDLVEDAGEMAETAGDVQSPGGFREAMISIRDGLQEFGKKPAKTLMGVATLAAAGVLLAVGLAAIFGAVSVVGGPMEMIAAGLALVGFAISFRIMADSLRAVKVSAIIQGALAMVILGAALVTAAFAFSLLKGVDTGAMLVFAIALPLLALAAAGLGFLAPYIIAGSIALAILGASIIPAALAFKLLGDVDPMMIINFAAGLLVLAGAAALMGMAIIPLMLGSIAIGMLSASLVVLGVGLMAITAGMPGIDALSSLLTIMAEQGMASAAGLLATGGAMFVFASALFYLAIASFFGAPALIALGAGMLALGIGVKFAGEGLESISKSLPKLAEGAAGLGDSVGMLGIAALYLMELGFASLIAAPGLLVGSFALGMLAATMGLFAAAVNLAIPGVGLLVQLGSMADAFASIAVSMWSMAAGIAAFATAGLLTLPTIMGLIALSFVAPILTLLGDSINYDLQGGGSSVQSKPEESEMKILIEEVRQLRAAFQTPGVINMDGNKVGDVLGLAVSNSGVS